MFSAVPTSLTEVMSHLFHNELNWLSVASCLTICAAWDCCSWWTSMTASTLHLPPSSWDTVLWAQHIWPTGFCWMVRQSGTLFRTVSELLIAALTVSDISWPLRSLPCSCSDTHTGDDAINGKHLMKSHYERICYFRSSFYTVGQIVLLHNLMKVETLKVQLDTYLAF